MQEGNPVGKEQISVIEEQIKEALREVELLITIRTIANRYAQRAKATQRGVGSSFIETVSGC